MSGNLSLDAAIRQSVVNTDALPNQASLEVHAPEWAVHDPSGFPFFARMIGSAALVVAALFLVYGPLTDQFPGEGTSGEETSALADAAAKAADDAASRQSAAGVRQDDAEDAQTVTGVAQMKARRQLAKAERALAAAADATQRQERLLRADVRDAGRKHRASKQRALAANQAFTEADDEWTLAAGARQTALDSLQSAASPRTTDADLVRVFAIGSFALLSLLGSVALAVPRPTGPLKYSLDRGAVRAGSGIPPANSDDSPQKQSSETTAPRSTEVAGQSGFALREPVVAQAGITAAALVAGLFGIQNTEGWVEAVINVLLPAIPVAGAFFARRRVWALANPQPRVEAEANRLRSRGGPVMAS